MQAGTDCCLKTEAALQNRTMYLIIKTGSKSGRAINFIPTSTTGYYDEMSHMLFLMYLHFFTQYVTKQV